MRHFLHCDNYASCNGTYLFRDNLEQTEQGARAHGWHIWHGTTQGGEQADAVLCHHCAGARRRALAPAPALMPGQQVLIQFEVTTEEE